MKAQVFRFSLFLLMGCSLLAPNRAIAQYRAYQTWELPEGAIARFGKGSISWRDRAIAFSPDGALLAVASRIGIWIYDVAIGRELTLLTGHTGWVSVVAFSSDGMTLASMTGRDIRLWDIKTQRELAILRGATRQVNSIAFSSDGTKLASGSSDGIVRLWNIEPEAADRNVPAWIRESIATL